MPRPIVIRAEWDDEAKVWVATSPDVAGFVTEADSLEELRAKVPNILLDLAEETARDLIGADLEYIAYARERLVAAE